MWNSKITNQVKDDAKHKNKSDIHIVVNFFSKKTNSTKVKDRIKITAEIPTIPN